MEKKKVMTILILLALCAVILIFPLLTIRGAAEEVIAAVDPGYEPWAEGLIALPGGETETLLFCLQAALGAVVIGFGFGYLVARKKYRAEEAA